MERHQIGPFVGCPVVERDNRPVADLNDVVEACPDLAVSVPSAESAVNFFCPWERGEGAWGHHGVGPCVGINHSSVTLSVEGCTDTSAIAGENDAAYEGTVLRHVAELDAQAPSLDAGWDLELANRPALAPYLTAEPPSGGALDVLVVAHPDAEAACERVEPFDQRGLRLAGFGALAELGHQGGEGVLGRRPGCLRVLLHRSRSAPNKAGCRLSR